MSTTKNFSSEKYHDEIISPELFVGHEQSSYWIGRVANMGVIEYPQYYDSVLKFRGNVYVNELGFLSPDHLDETGRETDKYDQNSIHFAVLENANEARNYARVVGSLRLIMNPGDAGQYPIEHYFPEAFEQEPRIESSAEVSRFIARYPEDPKLTQHMISLGLIRAATLYADHNEIEEYYCIIERPLMKMLGKIGIPMTELSEPKYIEEQGGNLHPIGINAQAILDSITTDKTGSLLLTPFFKHEDSNLGEGYYDASLIGGIV